MPEGDLQLPFVGIAALFGHFGSPLTQHPQSHPRRPARHRVNQRVSALRPNGLAAAAAPSSRQPHTKSAVVL